MLLRHEQISGTRSETTESSGMFHVKRLVSPAYLFHVKHASRRIEAFHVKHQRAANCTIPVIPRRRRQFVAQQPIGPDRLDVYSNGLKTRPLSSLG